MSNIIEFLKSQEAKEKLMSLYNLDEQAVDTQVKRYQKLADAFAEVYPVDNASFFSSSGRIEIIGNHTDHQLGRYRSCKYRHGYNRKLLLLMLTAKFM